MNATEVAILADSRHIPGAFAFFVSANWPGISGLNYVCPCGCGTIGEIHFTMEVQSPRSPTYMWDGNKDQPTIGAAMIEHIVAGVLHWRGVLSQGEWKGTAYGHGEAPRNTEDPASD